MKFRVQVVKTTRCYGSIDVDASNSQEAKAVAEEAADWGKIDNWIDCDSYSHKSISVEPVDKNIDTWLCVCGAESEVSLFNQCPACGLKRPDPSKYKIPS